MAINPDTRNVVGIQTNRFYFDLYTADDNKLTLAAYYTGTRAGELRFALNGTTIASGNLSLQTGSATATSNVSSGYLNWARWGRFVTFDFWFQSAVALNGYSSSPAFFKNLPHAYFTPSGFAKADNSLATVIPAIYNYQDFVLEIRETAFQAGQVFVGRGIYLTDEQ